MPLVTDGFITEDLPITDLPIVFWRNVVTTTNVSTDSQDPDFPVTNVANPSLALKWKQDFTDSPLAMPDTIVINAAGLGPINYVAIAGHNLGTAGATIAIEGDGNPSGISPASTASPLEQEWVTGFQPVDDSPLIIMFGEVEAQAGDRGNVRIRLQSPGTVALEIAVIYVGYATVLAEGIQADHTPLPLAHMRETLTGQSENATFLGRIVVGQWVESVATISNLEATWVRDELMPFLEFAAENPFFWAWQPLTYPDEVAFAWLSENPKPVLDIDGFLTVDLPMRGLVE